MSRLRLPAVAGLFYPDSIPRLRDMVGQFLEAGRESPAAASGPRALVAPHAGYVYSGPIAGSAFRALVGPSATFERVVVLGPSHFHLFEGLALPDADAYATPLGEVPIDSELVEAVRALPQVIVSDRAHEREHSLEVELPFLQETLGGFTLLPLVVGSATAESVAEVLERIWEPEVLIVVSSDLSHYLAYDEAVRTDTETAGRVVDLDPTIQPERACGAIPLNGLLLAAGRRGLAAHLVDLGNSGDTAGDLDRVVGYGAFELGAPP